MDTADSEYEKFADATVRLEHLIYLPSIAWCCDPPEVFPEEFCECLPERADHPLYLQLPVLRRFIRDDEPDPEIVSEVLSVYSGFLLKAATPIMKVSPRGREFSWAFYATAWLYAPTADLIASVAVAWAATQRAKEDAAAKIEVAR